MILQIIFSLLILSLLELSAQEQEGTLAENVSIVKKEMQKRKYLLQPKKYHFLLMNKQTVQFILVKQGRMFSLGIGAASDEKNKGYRLSVYELYDLKDYSSKELIEKFTVTERIFLREIQDTANYYLIEIEMSADNPNGSVVELVHGFAPIQLNAINKSSQGYSDINAGLCSFGNCGIIRRVDWGK